MRAALLLPPTGTTENFSPPGGPEQLRRQLLERSGRLVPVLGHLPFEQVMTDALQVGSHDDSDTLVVYASPHLLLGSGEALRRELEDHFEMATSYVDQELEAGMAEAYNRQEAGDTAGARERYLSLDQLLGREDSARHALVLVSLGELEHRLGERRLALEHLERALAIAPNHIGALRERAGLAEDSGESAIASAMLYRLVPLLQSDEERIDALSRATSESLRAARDAMKQALEFEPGSRRHMERLRAIHEASGEWNEAVRVSVLVAETHTDKPERARALRDAARMASARTGNTQLAVALYEAAIEDEPELADAFEAIESELVRSGDYAGVARAYERQLERLATIPGCTQRLGLWRRLAALARGPLNDRRAAIAALEGLLREDASDAAARIELASLLSETGQLPHASRVLQQAAELTPERAATYRSLHDIFEQLDDQDRAFNTCSVLVALGEADINEQLAYSQYAPDGLLPIGAFDEDIWEQLLPPDHPRALQRLVEAIEPGVLEAWLSRNERQLTSIVPAKMGPQDPAKTTISGVKAFLWAARVLGVPEPTIYAMPDNTTLTASTLPTRAPTLALGRQALSGRSLPELAFMAGRHLAFSRPGWRLLNYYSNLDDLRVLIQAAVGLVRPELATSSDARTSSLQALLRTTLPPAAWGEALAAVAELDVDSPELEVQTWLDSTEMAACRAALLVAGDVTVAAGVLSVAGSAPGGRSARERTSALLPYSVSQSYSALRHLVGVAIG